MKINKNYLVFLFLLLTSTACKDHARNNPFDVGAEGFMPLPPGYVFIYDVDWDSMTGRVYSIAFAVWYPETLSRGYYVYHTLSLNDTVLWTTSGTIEAGTEIYGYRMYYGYYDPWPTGEYWFCVYWGEVGVGAVPFIVTSEKNKSNIKILSDLWMNAKTSKMPVDTARWRY